MIWSVNPKEFSTWTRVVFKWTIELDGWWPVSMQNETVTSTDKGENISLLLVVLLRTLFFPLFWYLKINTRNLIFLKACRQDHMCLWIQNHVTSTLYSTPGWRIMLFHESQVGAFFWFFLAFPPFLFHLKCYSWLKKMTSSYFIYQATPTKHFNHWIWAIGFS